MTPEIKSRLKELNEARIEQSDDGFTLSEERVKQVRCRIKVAVPAILLKNLDKWELNCFKQKKCADYAMIKKEENGYSLHLFELKKTIRSTEWLKILQQFTGAFLRAEMIANFLNIPLCGVHVYTVYREERMNVTPPILLRSAISNGQERENIGSWGKSGVNICCFGTSIKCCNHKIVLDKNGNESIEEIT
jgi:hypothetical protein